MSLDQSSEIKRLRSVLRMQQAWIRHWRDDLRHNLPPTLDSLADAEDAINEAINQRETANAQ